MQNTDDDLSGLLGSFLRRRTASAKELALLIKCDPRTAEGFRAGRYWPNARHWKMIARTFRRDVLDAVYGPEIDATLTRLRREARELEEALHEKRAALRQALGDPVGPEERRFAAVDREAVETADLFEGRL